MLIERKDAGTGNKRVMYWKEEGCSPMPIPENDRELYWGKEIKRLKAALQYEVAKREAITDELEQEIQKSQAMLKLADAMLNGNRRAI